MITFLYVAGVEKKVRRMDEEKTKIPIEGYRLSLIHYIDDGENRHMLEEPLVIQMIYNRQFMPQPICINRMLDMMRDEVMRRVGEQE